MKFGIFSTVTKADERSTHQLFKENAESETYPVAGVKLRPSAIIGCLHVLVHRTQNFNQSPVRNSELPCVITHDGCVSPPFFRHVACPVSILMREGDSVGDHYM